MKPLIEFSSFSQWVNKARSWFQTCPVVPQNLICIDAKGRICKYGADFMLARDEDTFPVRAYHYRNLTATTSEAPEFEGPTPEQQIVAMERALAERMGGSQ
jgi:hypothetical protein